VSSRCCSSSLMAMFPRLAAASFTMGTLELILHMGCKSSFSIAAARLSRRSQLVTAVVSTMVPPHTQGVQ
jgi:hypothetical protein